MRILAPLKRGTAARYREVKRGIEPLKPAIPFFKLAVSFITCLVSMWAIGPSWAVGFAILIVLGVVVFYRREIFSALRGEDRDFEKEVIRAVVIVFSAGVSVILFLVAMLGDESCMPSLFAGALGLLALRAAEAQLKAQKIQRGFAVLLVENLAWPLLIFTAAAGIHGVPVFLLNHELDNGGITLGQLDRYSRFAINARTLFDRLHFSAGIAFGSAAVLMIPLWVECNWSRRQPAGAGFAWRVLRPGMKWTTRVAMAFLFVASFSSLAAHQQAPFIAAGVRDVAARYSRLQDNVEQRVERVLKRELMRAAWMKLDSQGRERIAEAVRNRKAFHEVEEAYGALSGLGLDDPEIAKTVSVMRAPELTREIRSHAGPAREPPHPPAGQERVLLGEVRFASTVEFQSKRRRVAESSEEVAEMDASTGSGIAGLLADNPNHRPLFEWLAIHFSGVDEILNSLRDAKGESVFESLQQARDTVLQRILASPRSPLDDLTDDEGRAAAARVRLHPIVISDTSRSISRERDTIQRAQASVRRRAPKIIADALAASKGRTERMANQIEKLDERYPSLHLATGGFFDVGDGVRVTAGQWALAALNRTSDQEAQLSALEKIKTLADGSSLDRLRKQLEKEQRYETLLAEVVGANAYYLAEMKSIVGSDFERYQKLYDTRWSAFHKF